MKKRTLTKEEIRYLRNSQQILRSQGIVVSDKDIREGLLGLLGSFAVGGAAGAALYWWLSDDAEDVIDGIKGSMEDVVDAANDLQDQVEDLYSEIDNQQIKDSMVKLGMSAAEAIKAVMSAQFETIKSEMQKVASESKESEGAEKSEKEEEQAEERAEAAEGAGGSEPMAFAVMAAATTKVLIELFQE
jgi:hypothetical protein